MCVDNPVRALICGVWMVLSTKRILPLLPDVEVENKVTENSEGAKEDAEQCNIRPPEGLKGQCKPDPCGRWTTTTDLGLQPKCRENCSRWDIDVNSILYRPSMSN